MMKVYAGPDGIKRQYPEGQQPKGYEPCEGAADASLQVTVKLDKEIEEAIEDAKAEFAAGVEELEAKVSELEGANEALEAEKAALEAENAELKEQVAKAAPAGGDGNADEKAGGAKPKGDDKKGK